MFNDSVKLWCICFPRHFIFCCKKFGFYAWFTYLLCIPITNNMQISVWSCVCPVTRVFNMFCSVNPVSHPPNWQHRYTACSCLFSGLLLARIYYICWFRITQDSPSDPKAAYLGSKMSSRKVHKLCAYQYGDYFEHPPILCCLTQANSGRWHGLALVLVVKQCTGDWEVAGWNPSPGSYLLPLYLLSFRVLGSREPKCLDCHL